MGNTSQCLNRNRYALEFRADQMSSRNRVEPLKMFPLIFLTLTYTYSERKAPILTSDRI